MGLRMPELSALDSAADSGLRPAAADQGAALTGPGAFRQERYTVVVGGKASGVPRGAETCVTLIELCERMPL